MVELITNIVWLLISIGWLGVTFFALAAVMNLFMALNQWLEDIGLGDEIEGEEPVKSDGVVH